MFGMDWFAYTIYKLNNGYLTHAKASWPWLFLHPTTVDFKSTKITMTAVFNWPITRTVYSFGAPYMDQQSKPGKPYMLDSLWLMDVIHVHSSTGNQIQIWWDFYVWYCFNNGKRLNFSLFFRGEK
ncbi:hypothetical protein LINPERPRIM_LOCUS26367 [Linum perenne]